MQQLPYSDIKTKTGPEADTSSFLNDEKKTEQEKKEQKKQLPPLQPQTVVF